MILTGGELEARLAGKHPALRGKKPPAAEPPKPVPEDGDAPKPAPAGPRVRMHHPDDPLHTMTCSVTVLGRVVKIERGVAEVDQDQARFLESGGWLRGAEVDKWKA